jgi:hypothetical protein
MESRVGIYVPRQDLPSHRKLEARAGIEPSQGTASVRGILMDLSDEELLIIDGFISRGEKVILILDGKTYTLCRLWSNGAFEAIGGIVGESDDDGELDDVGH